MNNDAALDATMTALAHPTRRAILARLRRGEARVTALAEPFADSLNTISKHIRVLEAAKLVRRRREGREHILSCNAAPLDQAAAWIDAHRRHWEAAFDRLATAMAKGKP